VGAHPRIAAGSTVGLTGAGSAGAERSKTRMKTYNRCRPLVPVEVIATPGMSRAQLVARRLHALDTDGGPLLGRPRWSAGAGSTHERRGGDRRRFDTTPHKVDCGIDLHARTMSLCLLTQEGEGLLHRHLQAAPEPSLKAFAPCREALVVCVECLFTWSGPADRCAREGRRFVLGHALSMHAIHGGKAQNDPTDAHHMAVLLRGGALPQAYVYPAGMRATRALLRRRLQLMRHRAELLTPVRRTTRRDHLPEIGKPLADTAHRDGVAGRLPEPAVQKSLEVAPALIGHYGALPQDLEVALVTTAGPHEANTLCGLPTVPGLGKILRLVLLSETHAIARRPRGQDCVSSCRWGKGATDSAGKRQGTSGTEIGKADLTWAVSEAALLALRSNPAGHKARVR
jgi:transposase